MAATLEDIKINVSVDSKKAVAGFKKVNKAGVDFEKSFKDIAKTFVGPLAAGAIAAGIVKIGSEFSKLASDAEETRNKFASVFKSQTDDVTQWADNYSKAFGRSTTDTMSYLATIQDTLVPLGFARDKASEFSKQVVKLSGDLGSFDHLKTADVVRDIQTALVGNTEVLKKYGVVASQAMIKQEALNSGLWDGKGAMDAQTKAASIMQIIMKGTKDAQGDLARTQNSTANTMVRLNSQWKQFGELLGGTLNKEVTPLASGLANLLGFMNDSMKHQSALKKAQEDVAKGTASLNDQLLIETDKLNTLNKRFRDYESGQKLIHGQTTKQIAASRKLYTDQIDSQKEVVQNLSNQIVMGARWNSLQKSAALESEVKAKKEKLAAAINAKLNADAIAAAKEAKAWTEKRQKAQNDLGKKIGDINSKVKAGLITSEKGSKVAAGQVEKEAALRATLNNMIEMGFSVEGSGYKNIINFAKKYGVELGKVAEEKLKQLEIDTKQKKAEEDKIAAAKKVQDAIDKLNGAYKETTAGQIEATQASIKFFQSFSDPKAEEVLKGLNEQLNKLKFEGFKNSFAEVVSLFKQFESVVGDVTTFYQNTWGATYDKQVQDAQDAYDKIAGQQDESVQKVKDEQDAKIQAAKDGIMQNENLSQDEKEKIQGLMDEKSKALEGHTGADADAIAAYYDKEISDAKDATALIQGMEIIKSDAVAAAEKKKTDALAKAEKDRVNAVQKAELEKFKAKKAADISSIVVNTLAAAVEALPNWIDSAAVTAAGIAAGLAAASAPEPSFALGTGGEDFIVPPGYNSDNFKMNVSSGEKVSVTSRDQTNSSSSSSGSPVSVNLNIDGKSIGKVMFNLSKDRLLTIDSGSIVTS